MLQRRCPECGFDAGAVPLEAIPGAVRENAAAWAPVLARPDVRVRPAPGVWSALEYGCHVRDTCRVFAERLQLMLNESDPLFANWNQDETAVAERYAEQDPQAVAAGLAGNAHAIADAFARVEPDEWSRIGPAQRRVGVHRGLARSILPARPGASPARRGRLTAADRAVHAGSVSSSQS